MLWDVESDGAQHPGLVSLNGIRGRLSHGSTEMSDMYERPPLGDFVEGILSKLRADNRPDAVAIAR
jgi:hypothetical protein